MAKRLTQEAEDERELFEAEYRDQGCTCFLGRAPCGCCTHPGNPHNQEVDECYVTLPDIRIPYAMAPLLQDLNVEQFLVRCQIPFTMRDDGMYFVDASIHMDGLGLKKLPDLRRLAVSGDFSCQGNGLQDLQGMPQQINGKVFIDGNVLKSFRGIPPHVEAVCLSPEQMLTLYTESERMGLDGAKNTLEKRSVEIMNMMRVEATMMVEGKVYNEIAKAYAKEHPPVVFENKSVQLLPPPLFKFKLRSSR